MICWSFSKSFSNASLFKQKICRTVHPPAALQRCQCSQHPGVPISSRQLCADRRQKQLRLRLHVGKDLRDTINRRLDPSSRFKQVLLSVSLIEKIYFALCWFFSQSVHALKTPRSFLESVSLLQSQTPYHLGAQKRQHCTHCTDCTFISASGAPLLRLGWQSHVFWIDSTEEKNSGNHDFPHVSSSKC